MTTEQMTEELKLLEERRQLAAKDKLLLENNLKVANEEFQRLDAICGFLRAKLEQSKTQTDAPKE